MGFPERFRQKRAGMRQKLGTLYGKDAGKVLKRLHELMKTTAPLIPKKLRRPGKFFSREDAVLIIFPDQIKSQDGKHIQSLYNFARTRLNGAINTIHILPFFPYSSDRGFSVKDFSRVEPKFGSWFDIRSLTDDFRFMCDLVLNHASQRSVYFHGFISGNPRYENYFHEVKSASGRQAFESIVRRPRVSPLFHNYGDRYIWTTFSRDQVDLNWSNPQVFIDMMEHLLLYVRNGMEILRLDAITYLWKKKDSESASIKEDHVVARLVRDMLDIVAPRVAIITETNVPHKENISYFGNGRNEAQMVYNFALPPLLVHTFHKQDASKLMKWMKTLKNVPKKSLFLNYGGSHDGIGLPAASKILTEQEMRDIEDRIVKNGGRLSEKNVNKDGKVMKITYEMNSTWWSALDIGGNKDMKIQRYLASRSIIFAMKGVPATYLHDLLGSPNNPEIDANRDINEKKFRADEIDSVLKGGTHQPLVFAGMLQMLKTRREHRAFEPKTNMVVHDENPGVAAISRGPRMLCLTNVSEKPQKFKVGHRKVDILTNKTFSGTITLAPYQYVWLASLQN